MLNEHESVSFASAVGMMKVRINAILPGAAGVLGTRRKSGLIGRDGEKVQNGLEMGLESAVQLVLLNFLASCIIPPEAPARRLGEDSGRPTCGRNGMCRSFRPRRDGMIVFMMSSKLMILKG